MRARALSGSGGRSTPVRGARSATSDASPVLINDWVKRNEANERYNLVFRQAREAQIPVLNANRFFILIGYTER